MEEKIPSILIAENKEKFRRKLLISSRIFAFLLILVLFWIGFIQFNYVQEINKIKTDYGSLGYCYLCGLETARTCSCNYFPELIANEMSKDEKKSYLENIASQNVIPCENINLDRKIESQNLLNFT